MISIKITVAGKEYKDFDDAIDAAIYNGIKGIVQSRLQPLSQEINANNIIVEIKAKSTENYSVTWDSENEDLNEKMKIALRG